MIPGELEYLKNHAECVSGVYLTEYEASYSRGPCLVEAANVDGNVQQSGL
jgi:hypothetical protein